MNSKTLTASLIAAAIGIALAGCDKEPIGMQEALSIAELSQDADTYKNEFALAIQDLSTKDGCQAEVMREGGGFSRVTGDSFYFLYCGKPINTSSRWYYDPANGKLSQDKSELRG